MRLVYKLILISVLLGNPARAFTNTAFYSVTCKFDNKSIQSTVYKNDCDGVVKWMPEAAFPLGMHTVRVNAEKAFTKIFPEYTPYTIDSINLVRIKGCDDWIFAVTFDGTIADSAMPAKLKGFQIIMLELLNGKVITPIVTVIPRSTNSNAGNFDTNDGHSYPNLYIPDLHSHP
jgi:hypothetical protein